MKREITTHPCEKVEQHKRAYVSMKRIHCWPRVHEMIVLPSDHKLFAMNEHSIVIPKPPHHHWDVVIGVGGDEADSTRSVVDERRRLELELLKHFTMNGMKWQNSINEIEI